MIFTKQLGEVDYTNAPQALKKMSSHIRYIQEQLEHTLMTLDSSNITAIDTSVTDVSSSKGSVSLQGEGIHISGENGEGFEAGKDTDGSFCFKVLGKGGKQMLYLTSGGELVITKHATITVDGGEW